MGSVGEEGIYRERNLRFRKVIDVSWTNRVCLEIGFAFLLNPF